MKETKYSVLPVYACALVWVLWALVIHFGAVWTYIVCALISAAAYGGLRAAFPPVKQNASPNKVTAAADWAALSNQFGEYAAVFQNSMLEAPLRLLNTNIAKISQQIQQNQELGNKSELRQVKKNYLERAGEQLKLYQQCRQNPNPGDAEIDYMETTEELFSSMAEWSGKVTDQLVAGNLMVLKADLQTFDQLFKHASQSVQLIGSNGDAGKKQGTPPLNGSNGNLGTKQGISQKDLWDF